MCSSGFPLSVKRLRMDVQPLLSYGRGFQIYPAFCSSFPISYPKEYLISLDQIFSLHPTKSINELVYCGLLKVPPNRKPLQLEELHSAVVY